MELLVVDIGATIAALVGYVGTVFWHDVTRETQTLLPFRRQYRDTH